MPSPHRPVLRWHNGNRSDPKFAGSGSKYAGFGGVYEYAPDREHALLGEGSFACVYRMRHKFDGNMYAVKLFREDNAAWTWEAVKREAGKMAKLDHQHIIRYHTSFAIDDPDFCCGLVLELCTGGTLADRIRDGNEEHTAIVMRRLTQLAQALNYLHNVARVVHLDVKSNNVLITSNDKIKLST